VEDYVHRIGRTGRGGASGISHTFFTDNDKSLAGEYTCNDMIMSFVLVIYTWWECESPWYAWWDWGVNDL